MTVCHSFYLKNLFLFSVPCWQSSPIYYRLTRVHWRQSGITRLTKFLISIYCFSFPPRRYNKPITLQNYQKPCVVTTFFSFFPYKCSNKWQDISETEGVIRHDVVGQRDFVVSSKGKLTNWQLRNWKVEQKYHLLSFSRQAEKNVFLISDFLF